MARNTSEQRMRGPVSRDKHVHDGRRVLSNAKVSRCNNLGARVDILKPAASCLLSYYCSTTLAAPAIAPLSVPS